MRNPDHCISVALGEREIGESHVAKGNTVDSYLKSE